MPWGPSSTGCGNAPASRSRSATRNRPASPYPRNASCGASPRKAIANVERHARASQVSVQWRCDGSDAVLVVADDGSGFPMGKAGRLDSYGMVGMRERADAIGAHLEFESTEGRGTTVRCRLEN